MIEVLLVCWIALLGLTRIDLLGGAMDFLLTPFLVLSPAVIVLGIGGAASRRGGVRLPQNVERFFLLVTLLLAVVVLSTFLAFDLESSAKRTVLLSVQIVGALLGGVVLANQREPREILYRGALLGLGISLLFNFLQLVHWFTGELLPDSAAAVISLEPSSYAGVVPRLTGMSHDPNLGGLLLLGYLFLVVALGPPSRLRSILIWAAGISIVLTLSRSAILAGLVVLLLHKAKRADLRISQRMVLAGAGAAGVMAATLLVFPSLMDGLVTVWEILGGRLSFGEGSSREHAAIFARGWEVATSDAKHLLLGVGYGNAYTVLQDIFPGSRYGNFHSLFMTLFAEAGIVAAVLGIALFLPPLLRGGMYQPMIAGLLVFNLFQQSQTEPMMWVLLMLAWTGLGAREVMSGERVVPGAPSVIPAEAGIQ